MGVAFMLGTAWSIVGFGLIARGVKYFGYSRGAFEHMQCIADCVLGIFILFVGIVFSLTAIGVV